MLYKWKYLSGLELELLSEFSYTFILNLQNSTVPNEGKIFKSIGVHPDVQYTKRILPFLEINWQEDDYS